MRAAWLAAGAAILITGCTTTSNVTLLADEGKSTSGAVAVLDAKSESEIGQLAGPDSQAKVGGKRLKARPYRNDRWANLLGWVPYGPRTYVLYFAEGGLVVDPGSLPMLDALRKSVDGTSEVQITGHTDTVGDSVSNDQLSIDRAREVRAVLVKQGLPLESARVTGRGERELLVPTADDTSEPANRRVEVILR